MKKNKQLICDDINGDCFRACLTSILDLDNRNDFPNTTEKSGYSKWLEILEMRGLTLIYEEKPRWIMNGYWIASVPSLNFKKCTHAIVMKGTKVAFDPSLKKKYRIGTDLLGKQIVKGGEYLLVTDLSKVF